MMHHLSPRAHVSRTGFILMIAALMICLMVSATAARAWFASANISHRASVPPEESSMVMPGPVVSAPAPAIQGTPDERIEVELITVTPQGFEPAEVTRPHEPFILAVHNNSGAPTLSLQLDRVHGQRVSEVKLPLGGHRSHQRINPQPGEYVLSETNHPAWRCLIRINN